MKIEELNEKELDKYSRQVMLEEIGYQGQIQLKNAKVCVVGTGGLGQPVITRLATMGIGNLRIVDRDIIELSNLHRQVMFDEDDIGQVKVEVVTNKIKKLNPDCNVEPLPMSLIPHNAIEIIRDCDIVIDALDNANARYALNEACITLGIPFITGAAVGSTGQVFTVLPKQSACYSCVFPDLGGQKMPTCSIEGVNPPILSIVGAIQVTEAVKIITKKEPSLINRMLTIDLETLEFKHIKTTRVKNCKICDK
jgi:adenylyltransferase/sulfurtransferase